MTSVNPICTLKTNIRPTDGPTDTVAYYSKTKKNTSFLPKGWKWDIFKQASI